MKITNGNQTDVTQAEIRFTEGVNVFKLYFLICIRQLPSSLSDLSSEKYLAVIVTGDQINHIEEND